MNIVCLFLQEPGTNEEIKEFVKNNYNGQFDMFSKIDVNGNNAHPFWKYLKMKQTGTFGRYDVGTVILLF